MEFWNDLLLALLYKAKGGKNFFYVEGKDSLIR